MLNTMKLLFLPFKLLWYALIWAVPLLGIWLASTLTVFLNGPRWLPWLAGGLVLFLPLLWELESQWRWQRKQAQHEVGEETTRRLRVWDRLVLRTLALNWLFVGLQLGRFPQQSFAALATRGDWMLEGQQAAWVPTVRQGLFRTADGLEWLYTAVQHNPYARLREGDNPKPDPKPDQAPVPEDFVPQTVRSPLPTTEASPQTSAAPPPHWPLPDQVSPLIAEMPTAAETSIDAVAAYIAAGERDPYRRAKAIYDYVTTRIRYDVPALQTRTILSPQDAETVFRQHLGVCAGYANLFKALAERLELPTAFVVGDSRSATGEIAGISHAWNAVRINQKWYLLDATWGSGYVEQGQFKPRYTSAYLLTPPSVFAMDHLPEDPQWQLRSPPLDRGEFARQPLLRASFFERGWELRSPKRSQISVGQTVALQLTNQRQQKGHQYLSVQLEPRDGGTAQSCQVSGQSEVQVNCAIPQPGRYRVRLFGNTQPTGTFEYIGQIEVVSG